MEIKVKNILLTCFKCGNKVFEIEDDVWACDSCKTIWSYQKNTWVKVDDKGNKIEK